MRRHNANLTVVDQIRLGMAESKRKATKEIDGVIGNDSLGVISSVGCEDLINAAPNAKVKIKGNRYKRPETALAYGLGKMYWAPQTSTNHGHFNGMGKQVRRVGPGVLQAHC